MVEITCPQCNYNKNIPCEMIPPEIKWIRCPNCGNKFEHMKKEDEVTPEKIHPIPWERRQELGLWRSITHTIRSATFSPTTMFSHFPVSGGWREPLAFGLLIGSISSMCAFFWEFMIATSGFIKPLSGISMSFSSPILFLSLVFLSPLLVTIDLFISSFIIHLLLLLVKSGKNKFEATFRVVAYSQATRVWSLLPLIGNPIGYLWRSVVQVIGLKEAHETSYLRVIIAFSIPLVLLLLIAFGAFFVIINLISP